MLLIGPIVKAPKESQMAFSTQVKEALDQAAEALREALAFAARTEHSLSVATISDLLCRIETLEQTNELMCQFAAKQTDESPTN